ncbi:MAG TPA: DUF1153 domain-containing protein [Bacteroidetes bacterium]|nr:DUF1153 domain-containing protein [Bacteroidota bacterium]
MTQSNLEAEKIKHPKGRRWPISVKREALEALDSGLFTMREVMEMYEVRTTTTLGNWRKQLARSSKKRKFLPEMEKRRIAYEVCNGGLSIESAMAEYGVLGKKTISGWIARYVTDYEIGRPMKEKKPKQPENPGDQDTTAELEALRRELEEAQLKALALETLIEVAEEELGVEIRKKLGAKLSEECE